MPIKRIKFYPRHPHVVVFEGDDENISLGLTSSNTRGDLIPVTCSNGKKVYMKRTATRQNKNLYDSRVEKYKLDKQSEEKAYEIAKNKLLNDIGKKTYKKKKRKS